MELSKRLQTVANAVTPGSRVADVGTDHGYVPIYLVERGLCPGAIAMDVNEGPLARAEEHIRAEGLSDRIQTRKSDGLAALAPEETDAVVIAGMGGALMCRILQDAIAFLEAGRELILQPQSEWFKVRRLLSASGYRITQEWFLEEEGKYYVVIKAGPAPGKDQESRAGNAGGDAASAAADDAGSDAASAAVGNAGGDAANGAAGDAGSNAASAAADDAGGDAANGAAGDAGDRFTDDFTCRYGAFLLDRRDPVLIAYLKKEAQKKRQILHHLSETDDKQQQRRRQLAKELWDIEEYLGM